MKMQILINKILNLNKVNVIAKIVGLTKCRDKLFE